MADGDARPSTARSSPAGSPRRKARRPPREDRLLHPLARLLLEPRQRPLPARRAARAARARPRRDASSSPRTAGASRTSSPTTAQQGLAAVPRRLSRARARSAYGADFDAAAACDGADLVLVHEWNEPALVAALGAGAGRGGGRFTLLFHDTHHRAVSDPAAIRAFDLSGYDGVLAFGEALAAVYRRWGWGERAFVWHEAADVTLFRPPAQPQPRGGLVWIGNWGDGERTEELETFLMRPPPRPPASRSTSTACATRPTALAMLARHGARYRGWLAERRGAGGLRPPPRDRARAAALLRRALPGIPTIRVFEALACGIPLVCAPWDDSRGAVPPRRGLPRRRATGAEMTRQLRRLRDDAGPARRASSPAASRASARATPAPTASTSCSPSPRRLGAPAGGGRAMRIAFFGSSLLSAYWNGAATYYRGLLRSSPRRGHARHLLRARRLRAPAAPRHRPARLGARRRLAGDRGRRPRRRRRGARRPTSSSRRAASASSTTCCSTAVDGRRAPGRGPHLLGRRRPGDARRDARATPAIRCAAPLPAARPRAHLRRRPAGGRRLRRARRPRLRADLQRPRPRRPTTRCRPTRASPPTSRFLANRLPDREARVEEFFLAPAARLPDRRFLLGGNGWDDKPMSAQRPPPRPRRHRATTTPSTPRRSPCSTSPATAWPRSASRRPPGSSRPPAPAPA